MIKKKQKNNAFFIPSLIISSKWKVQGLNEAETWFEINN